MTEDVIATVQAEEISLLAKLAAVRAFLGVYAPPSGEVKPVASSSFRAEIEQRIKSQEARQERYADRVRAMARELIETRTAPVPTREIVDYVQRKGVEIRGQSAQNALSALLSRHPDFENFDRQGWAIVRPDTANKGKGPDENEALNGIPASASETDIEGADTPEMSPSTPIYASDREN